MGCAASSSATAALSADDAATGVAAQQQPPPQLLERSEPMLKTERERDSEPEPVQVGPSSAGHMYTVGEELGKGSFGVVVKFIREDGTVFAAKCFNKAALKRKRMGWGTRTALDLVFEEIAVMKLLDHPNVLKLHEVMDDDHRGKIFLVVEYMPHGSCDPKEHGLEFFEEERARRYFNDTLLGLEELHNHGILHHDIKPENLLLTQDDRVKIGDLGIAQVCVPAEWDSDGVQHDNEELRKAEVCTSWAGTPAFLAPEVARGLDSFDGAPVDIWALGVSLWHMLMGSLPFCEYHRIPCAHVPMEALRSRSLMVGADSEYELYIAIADGPVVLPTDAPISAAARELLIGGEANGSRGILAKDAASRMTIAQIRESDFVSKGGTEPLPPSLHVRNYHFSVAPCARCAATRSDFLSV